MCNKVESIKGYILGDYIDICAITETWLSENNEPMVGDFKADRYKLLHVDYSNMKGGGVFLILI